MKTSGKIRLYIFIIICMIMLCLILVGCKSTETPISPTPPPDNTTSEKPIPDTPTTADKLTIHFNDMGVITSIEYTDDIITLPTPKHRNGYEFLYWLAEDGSPILSKSIHNNSTVQSIILSAAWSANNYKLHLKYNDGYNNSSEQQYNIDTEDLILPVPFRLGYDFLGWFNGSFSTPISKIKRGTTGDLTLNAKWKTQTYTITYSNVEEGHILKEEYNITTDDFTLPTPKMDRCEFLGWYQYKNLVGEKISNVPKGSSGNLTLFAKWSAPKYNITYELNGGSGTGLVYTYSSDIKTINLEKNLPIKENYKFLGWYSHPDCTDLSLLKTITCTDTIDYKLYAAWTSSDGTANIKYSSLKCSAADKDSLNPLDHDACHYSVVGVSAGPGNVFNVVGTYMSRPVTTIDRLAFQTLKGVTIKFPVTVTDIGDEAFSECSNTTILLPDKLKTIGMRAFYKTNGVVTTIPASVKNGLGKECFAYSKNCTFNISEGVTALPFQAFFSASINSIILPLSIESLGDNAFAGISNDTHPTGTFIKLGGKISYWGGGLLANSKISKLNIDHTQTTITYVSLFDLYNIDTNYCTPISLSRTLANYIAKEIYFRIMGFHNANFAVNFDCSTVNNNNNLLGHYSSGIINGHTQENVCISRQNDTGNDSISSNIILDLKSINTITHETRHYFQNLCYGGKIKSVSSSKIPYELLPDASELATWNPNNYITADSPEKYPHYYHQPVEEDARRTATEITGYFPKHEYCILCPPKTA